MASQVSLAIHSLTSMCLWMKNVFMDEECVYRISINGMKEMEKGDEELGFSLRKKALSFHTKEWLHSVGTLRVSRVWSIHT